MVIAKTEIGYLQITADVTLFDVSKQPDELEDELIETINGLGSCEVESEITENDGDDVSFRIVITQSASRRRISMSYSDYGWEPEEDNIDSAFSGDDILRLFAHSSVFIRQEEFLAA